MVKRTRSEFTTFYDLIDPMGPLARFGLDDVELEKQLDQLRCRIDISL